MPVYDLFHKRQKRLRGDVSDVFVYDQIPAGLRTQLVHVMNDALGDEDEVAERYYSGELLKSYTAMVKMLRRELHVFSLPYIDAHRSQHANERDELVQFILYESDFDKWMSAVELACHAIDRVASRRGFRNRDDARKVANEALSEINQRFRENGLGWSYELGEMIRVDSQHIHAEAVVPALTLLRDKRFAGADQEFRSAFDHYRKSNHKEAMVDALKSFESTMKVICAKRQWPHDPKVDGASKLLKACFDNGLIDPFWQAHLTGLRATLEAGVPTGRNKLAGHGQGATPIEVPDYLASYVLHMTASAIVFLVKAEQALP